MRPSRSRKTPIKDARIEEEIEPKEEEMMRISRKTSKKKLNKKVSINS